MPVQNNAIIQNDASGDNCIVLYPGANRAIDRDFVDQVLDGYGKGDWLLLQNEISELPYIVSRAKARGMFIVLNPSPADSRLDEVDLDAIGCFVPNEGAHEQPAVRADHADEHAAPEQLVEDGLAVVEMPTEQQEVRTGLSHFERLALVGLT